MSSHEQKRLIATAGVVVTMAANDDAAEVWRLELFDAAMRLQGERGVPELVSDLALAAEVYCKAVHRVARDGAWHNLQRALRRYFERAAAALSPEAA